VHFGTLGNQSTEKPNHEGRAKDAKEQHRDIHRII
jgi:hypothetical protein